MGCRVAALSAVLVWPLGLTAQALPPVPPPVSACVSRYGHTGCAAKLYAEVLCQIVGQPADLNRVKSQLHERFSEEQIDFEGIPAAQVETAAVRYYVPQVCPPKQELIWGLLLPPQAG